MYPVRTYLLVTCSVAQLISCTSCAGNDDAMIVPSQVLANSRTKKEVHLDNGPDIYGSVAGLFDQPAIVAVIQADFTTEDVNIAWESNSDADRRVFTASFAKGVSVLDILRELAARRKENIAVEDNHLIITVKAKDHASLHTQLKSLGASRDLDLMVRAVIPTSIVIREPEGDAFGKFINAKLQSTWMLFHDKGRTPFQFKLSDEAKAKLTKLNIIGNWTYKELLDTAGLISDSQWRIDGANIHFGQK